jgi:hypothetical protein
MKPTIEIPEIPDHGIREGMGIAPVCGMIFLPILRAQKVKAASIF